MASESDLQKFAKLPVEHHLDNDGVDWDLIDIRLAVAVGPEGSKRRNKLFQQMDPNGNGSLSLTEVQAGLPPLLESEGTKQRKTNETAEGLIPGVNDFKPAIKAAFRLARSMGDPSGGDSATVDRSEFHGLLVYFRHYLELLALFKKLDDSGDMLLGEEEILPAMSRLAKWDITKELVKHKLKLETTGQISFDHFSEWCLRNSGELQNMVFDTTEGADAKRPPTADQLVDEHVVLLKVDWAEVDKHIPTQAGPAGFALREKLFKKMDVLNKGQLTHTAVQASMCYLLEGDHATRKKDGAGQSIIPGIRDTRPAVQSSFSAASDLANVGKKKAKNHRANDASVDRREFHAFLVYLRYYLELQVLFQELDTSEDLRVSKDECEKAMPLLVSWALTRPL